MKPHRTAGEVRRRLRGQATGLDHAGQIVLGSVLAAALDDGPVRPGGLADQFATRIAEMAGHLDGPTCACRLCS